MPLRPRKKHGATVHGGSAFLAYMRAATPAVAPLAAAIGRLDLGADADMWNWGYNRDEAATLARDAMEEDAFMWNWGQGREEAAEPGGIAAEPHAPLHGRPPR